MQDGAPQSGRKLLATLALLTLLAACDGPVKVNDTDVQLLAYSNLVAMLQVQGKDRPILVDVRSRSRDRRIASRFQQGHIDGAINIPVLELKRDHPQLDLDRPIIVYSDGYNARTGRNDPLSLVAAKKLMACGYDIDLIYDFRGGVYQWQKEGRRLTKSRP